MFGEVYVVVGVDVGEVVGVQPVVCVEYGGGFFGFVVVAVCDDCAVCY